MSAKQDAAAETRSRTEPQSLRLRSISPSLTASDLEASVRWYREVVGFTVQDEWREEGELTGVSLVAGACRLMLSQDDGAKGRDRVKGLGFRLYMATAQDIDQLAGAIQARGGTLDQGPADQPWGGRAFTLVDPDGFKLTIASEG